VTIRKALFGVCAVFSLLLASCAGKAVAPPPSFLEYVPSRPDAVKSSYPLEETSGRTASEYFRDEEIFSGWNLGNSLDSHNDGIGGETTWGNPPISEELMAGVKEAGFDIIRIPVTWMGSIGPAPDYRVSTQRLQRVSDAVDMAHNAGLKVIINLHHDGKTENGGKDTGWLSIGRATSNQNSYNLITAQYVRLWQQIAAYFKNYGEWLIFEGFNELHDGSWQTCNDPRQFATLNSWNQLFVDAVRSSGANNRGRYLMVNAYCADNRQALSNNFTMPTDPREGRLILGFHYYNPYELTIGGSLSSWGTNSEKQRVENDFAPFKERFIDKGIPVIMGECGAVLQLYGINLGRHEQARQSREDYISHVFGTAKKYGIVPIYWDNGATTGNGEKFGLFDRRTGKPNSEVSDALLTTMINAVK